VGCEGLAVAIDARISVRGQHLFFTGSLHGRELFDQQANEGQVVVQRR
jgi:hypothetical protein